MQADEANKTLASGSPLAPTQAVYQHIIEAIHSATAADDGITVDVPDEFGPLALPAGQQGLVEQCDVILRWSAPQKLVQSL